MKKLFFFLTVIISNIVVAQYDYDATPKATGPDAKFIRYIVSDIFTNPQVKEDLLKYGIEFTNRITFNHNDIKFSDINFPIISDTNNFQITYEFILDYDYDEDGNFLNYNGNSHEEVRVTDKITNRPIYIVTFTYINDRLYVVTFYKD